MPGTTYLANLVNPQVMGDLVDKKLINAIRFAPLADIDETLVGQPGDTISLPFFEYIGAAQDVSESASLVLASLNASYASVTVKEAGLAVGITDRAALSGYGDPIGQGAEQVVKAMADKVDIDLLGILGSIGSTMTYTTSASTAAIAVADIANALELFGEDVDGQKVLLASPKLYTAIRATKDWAPASEFAAEALVAGSVGQIFGCNVVVTNRLKGIAGTGLDEDAYIVKPGALRIFLKRDSLVETDRDILYRKTIITITKHYAAYLYNAANAIKIAVGS
ncbi:MAG: N4-gp56 family major capsid protein [Treponema sp.]|nr:N4-gp56 family major capsid protein [Treponema sp.]